MAFLVTPPAYMTLTDFQSIALDYDLSSYTNAQLQDMLVRASGKIDAILGGTLLANEEVRTIYGDGSNTLDLHRRPLLYVRKIQFLQPGVAGYILPPQTLSLDGLLGQVVQYYPIELQGIGQIARFPDGMPFEVTYGFGYGPSGFTTFSAPTWSAVDVPMEYPGLTPGTYTVGVTTKTRWGETIPSYQNITTATGSFAITVQPSLGAYLYRVFLAAGANASANAMLNAEIPPTTYGYASIVQTISQLASPAGYYPESAPTADTSAPALPQEFREAMRLLVLSNLYEQNSLANRGIQATTSGRKDIRWRSTEGNSGKGVPRFYEEAEEALSAYKFQEIY